MPNIPWTRVSTYNNFTPTAFTGCTLWLDAADSSSISTTSGNVTQWRDKSGTATKQWPPSGSVYITTGARTHPNTIFTGRIGAFKVYNSVLSAADIKQNYNALAGRYGLGLI